MNAGLDFLQRLALLVWLSVLLLFLSSLTAFFFASRRVRLDITVSWYRHRPLGRTTLRPLLLTVAVAIVSALLVQISPLETPAIRFALVLVGADGVSVIDETLYEDRFDYTGALIQMGARIWVSDAHTAVFHGPGRLRAAEAVISDLRAGATLVLAALAAEGESRITGIDHVKRGYEDLVGKLSAVGARIGEVCP